VDDKAQIRDRLRRDRRLEPPAARALRAAALRGAAAELRPLARGGTAGFQPTNHEPDIAAMLRELAHWAPVYLPRTDGSGLEWVAGAGQLVGGLHGIPQPHGDTLAVGPGIVTALGVTLILVPALAVDPRTGARLGYGAGFYDRFLAGLPGRAGVAVVGVCRSADLVPLPVEAHDEPVDRVLTESGLALCGPGDAPE
jgi:5-formyltetrahydrofolate cyclo-ligase